MARARRVGVSLDCQTNQRLEARRPAASMEKWAFGDVPGRLTCNEPVAVFSGPDFRCAELRVGLAVGMKCYPRVELGGRVVLCERMKSRWRSAVWRFRALPPRTGSGSQEQHWYGTPDEQWSVPAGVFIEPDPSRPAARKICERHPLLRHEDNLARRRRAGGIEGWASSESRLRHPLADMRIVIGRARGREDKHPADIRARLVSRIPASNLSAAILGGKIVPHRCGSPSVAPPWRPNSSGNICLRARPRLKT